MLIRLRRDLMRRSSKGGGRPPPLGGRARLVRGALIALFIAATSGLALVNVLPGQPLAHGELRVVGATMSLPTEVAGRRMALRIRARLASEIGSVVVAVDVAGRTLEARLAPVRRRAPLGRRHAHVIDANAEMVERLALPSQPGQLVLTRLVGVVDGPIVIDLLPVRTPPLVFMVIGCIGVLLAGTLGALQDSRLYAICGAAGVMAPALAGALAIPGSGLSQVAGFTFLGAILGVVTGMTIREMLGNLLRRSRASRGMRRAEKPKKQR